MSANAGEAKARVRNALKYDGVFRKYRCFFSLAGNVAIREVWSVSMHKNVSKRSERKIKKRRDGISLKVVCCKIGVKRSTCVIFGVEIRDFFPFFVFVIFPFFVLFLTIHEYIYGCRRFSQQAYAEVL